MPNYVHIPTGKIPGVEVSVERYFSNLHQEWHVKVLILDSGIERQLTIDEASKLVNALNEAIDRGVMLWSEVTEGK